MTTIEELQAAIHPKPDAAPLPDPSRIDVPMDFLLEQYLGEIARLAQRAITAETQVAVLQARAAARANQETPGQS